MLTETVTETSEIEEVVSADDVYSSPENETSALTAPTAVSMGVMQVSACTCPFCSASFIPGQVYEPVPPAKAGKKLLTRVKELMNERSRQADGTYNYRFDDVANQIVLAMERGYWPAIQEWINREEGKVPNRVAGADGQNLKMYIGMPTEGEEAP